MNNEAILAILIILFLAVIFILLWYTNGLSNCILSLQEKVNAKNELIEAQRNLIDKLKSTIIDQADKLPRTNT